LESNAAEIAKALPRGMTIERLSKVLLFSIDSNPDLLKCTQVSLLRAIKECVTLGLEPGGVRGLAYLIPYKVGGQDFNRECQLIIGYKGLRELAMRSGMLQQLEARAVHRNDRFTVRFGLHPELEHTPELEDPGPIVAVYCLARLADDEHHVEVMTLAEITAIRARSKAGNSGPWVSDFEQMARKTVIRRAMNYMTLSPEVADALERDGDTVEGSVTQREASFAPAIAAPQQANVLPITTQAAEVLAPIEQMVETKEEQAPPAAKKTPPAPEPKPEVEAPVDDLERERRLVARAITESTTLHQLETLVTRIGKLPSDVKDSLREKYTSRSKELRGAK
jgi:recombination protein RecT